MMKRFFILGFLLALLWGTVCGQTYILNAALNGQTITTCSGTFYDSGGPNGDYSSSQNYIVTFVSATPGLCIQVHFTSFYLESATWDYLKIFDGSSTSGLFLGKFGGQDSPGTVTSSTGALTFVFHSDGSVNHSGWAATISCVECPPPPPSDCNPQSTAIGSPCATNGIHPFCTEDNDFNVAYPSVSGSQTASSFLGSSSYSCLSSSPRPSWYYLQIESPGNLLIYIESRASVLPNGQPNPNSAGRDIDFACWGPFEAQNQEDFVDKLCCGYYSFDDIDNDSHRPSNGSHATPDYGSNPPTWGGYPEGNLVDCSYDAASTEWCYIPNAQPGQWYLLLVCNYSSYSGYFGFTSQSTNSYGGGQATTNCNLLAPISYNSPLCEGDTLVLTCTNPLAGATYHWYGPGDWTATTTVPTVSILNATANQSGQYTLQITSPGQVVNPSHIEVSIDSMPQLTLTVSEDTICRGTQISLQAQGASSYVWSPGGSTAANRTVTPSATTTYMVTGSVGSCSATASHTVVVYAIPTVNITTVPSNRTICKGDTAILYASGGETYMWVQGGDTIAYTDTLRVSPAANTTYQVTGVSAEGCTKSASKSIIVRSLPTVSISGASSTCRGDSVQLTSTSASQYVWNTGATTRTIWVHPDETSDYSVMVTNSYGCMASDTVQVRVFLSDTSTYKDTTCWNRLFHDANFNLTEILPPGNHQFSTTYQTSASCDSVVILDLTVLPMIPVVWYDTSCVSYQWRNQTYTQTGIYVDSTLDAHACLQVDTLHLTIREAYETVETVTACESYTWINGETYTESTETPSYTMTAISLCDSVIHLHLTVYHAEHEYVEKDTCSYYQWRDTTYTESGVYTFSANDAHGCPYTDTLILSLHYASPASMNAQSCDSYQWNGTTYNTSGVYTYGHADVNGCWQVDTLHLSITPPVHQSTTVSACESYEWHGTTYTQSGNYLYAQTDPNGCSQIDTLHLTVHHVVPNVEQVIICEPNTYTWHGFQHSVTGVHTYNYIDQHNCECVDTLYLTVTTEPELALNMILNATCNQDNGEIKVNATGGTEPYRYVYLPSGEEAYFEGLSAGYYHLQMIDSIGCFAEVDFNIENIIHQVNLVDVTDAHCGRADGSVQIAASGGYGEFTYQWSSPITSTSNLALFVPAGNYSVAVVDSDGCSLSLSFSVNDIPGPNACFSFNTANEKNVTFINCTSQDVVAWHWSFGDGQGSTEWQPTHTYEGTGTYPVVLTVEDGNQCVDSLSLMYVIREIPTFFLPSAFIPESDIAENRVFKPIGNSISDKNYEMRIYDRWGQLIFVSHQPDYGWDGHIGNSLAPQGSYTYQIKYQDLEGLPNSVHGSVLLLRGETN